MRWASTLPSAVKPPVPVKPTDSGTFLQAWHGFEPVKGEYSEPQFALFDYVIESAKRTGIKLIPVFENYWEAYGGIDKRLEWEGLTGGHPGRAKFFNKEQCPGCFTQYKNYVEYALNRVNHCEYLPL